MRDRYASVHIDVDPARAGQPQAEEIVERPFRLLLIGDFSARGHRAQSRSLAEIPASLAVDRDDFDTVLQRLSPRIHLALQADSPHVAVTFENL
jgi:predicted component of type VI protein secretion system